MEIPTGKVTSVRFLKVGGVIDDLKRERVDQVLSYKYLLGLMIIHNVAMSSGGGEFKDLLFTVLWWGITIGLTIFEIRTCYLTNKSGDNRDFVKRYICISFVIELITLIVMLAAGSVLVVGVSALINSMSQEALVDGAMALSFAAMAFGAAVKIAVIFWKRWAFQQVSKPLAV